MKDEGTILVSKYYRISEYLNERLVPQSYEGFYFLIICDLLAAITYSLLLANNISNQALLYTWLILMIVINDLLRLAICSVYYYQNKYTTVSNLSFWKYYFIFNNILSGILWAMGGLLFIYVPDQTIRFIIFIFLIGLLGAASSKMLTYNLANIGYMIPIYIVVVFLIYSINTSLSLLIFIASLLYISLIIYSSIFTHNLIIKSILLELENKILIENLGQSERNFHNIVENTPISMAILSTEGFIIDTNKVFHDIFQYSKDDVINMKMSEMLHSDDAAHFSSAIQYIISGRIDKISLDARFICKNDDTIWTVTNISIITNESNGLPNIICQIQDITKRKNIEMQLSDLYTQTKDILGELKLREAELTIINKMNQMLQISHNAHEAYNIINIMAKKYFHELSGGLIIFDENLNQADTVQQWGDKRILKEHFNIDECWAFRERKIYIFDKSQNELMCEHFITSPDISMCVPLLTENKVIGLLFLTGNSILAYQQQAIAFAESIKLALANIKLREALKEQALHDALTGLFNRRYFDEALQRELVRVLRNKKQLCLATLDIDNFKTFNDKFGHKAGDEILRAVGEVLRRKFRGNDISCRFGGDEFLLLLMDTNLQRALPRLNAIRDELCNQHINVLDQELPTFTVSIGLAEAPAHGSTVDDILRASDEALYAAKAAGRNRIEIFSKS